MKNITPVIRMQAHVDCVNNLHAIKRKYTTRRETMRHKEMLN